MMLKFYSLLKGWGIRVLLIVLCFLFGLSGSLHAQSKDFLMGKINYTKDTSFSRVSSLHARPNVYLKKEAHQAFVRMHDAALKDGIKLTIISGTRSFFHQQMKWNEKWAINDFAHIKEGVDRVRQLLRWWSMPGISRHHWGTEVDLNNLNLAYYSTAEGKKLYNWLKVNAPKFGFHQPFNAGRSSGYQEEKWDQSEFLGGESLRINFR